MSNELRNFLALSYDELEELNLKAKEQRKNRVAAHKIQEERIKYLTDEKRIKAVTVLFSDLEGRLHMLDYDKKFLIKSWDNLTFDGSSILCSSMVGCFDRGSASRPSRASTPRAPSPSRSGSTSSRRSRVAPPPSRASDRGTSSSASGTR